MSNRSPRKDDHTYRALRAEAEAVTEALVILVIASFLGIFGGFVHCSEYARCHDAGTCSNASRWRVMELSCSFTNHVSIAGDALYGSSNASYFSILTRSVCAAGERLHVNSVTGSTECAPWRSWPSALNAEIMQPEATDKHDQMCGAWIQAGPLMPQSVEYWSFYDTAKANAAIVNAETASYSSTRLAATDMGKFYAACQQAILAGSAAIRASAKGAYVHLKSALGSVHTVQDVMEAAGWLASHYCDGPVLMGTTVSSAKYHAVAYRGSSFGTGTLAEALFAMDEELHLQNLAERGNSILNANAMSSPAVTMQDLDWLFEGATSRLDHANVPLLYRSTPELDGLKWLADNGYMEEARAFLHGQAAMCAFALQGSLDVEAAGEWSLRSQDLTRMREERPKAASLGRLAATATAEHLFEADNETLAQASTVSWSQLKAEPVGNPSTDCPALARFLFPDRLDREHFDAMVTPTLHSRIESMSEHLRTAVQWVVQNHPSIVPILQDPAAVADAVSRTRIRLAGARRASYGGIVRDYADGLLDSTDGPMVMALKQARAIFMDRVNILFDDLNVCTGPPVMDAMSANGYIYPGYDCTHILLGIMRKPFADERYDNVSLASRLGYIIAHELAHNTRVTTWDTTEINSVLSRYSTNYHSEALADLVSALAIMHAGYATAEELCSHISQLWCARVPLTWQPSTTAAHPGPNERSDKLCQTFVDLGLM